MGTLQETQERAARFAGRHMSEDELRNFLEDQHAQEWTDKFGDWLPGVQMKLARPSVATKVEIEPNKPRK